jgi:hypothetical protein
MAGREIKHTGDGIMASFDNVANSVRAAADIQRRFAAYNADASETLSVRIGTSTLVNRSKTTATCLARRCNLRRGYAAKPRPTASSYPESRASCAMRTRGDSWRSASGDSRALPTRLTSPGLSGRTDRPIVQDETQFLPLVSSENKGEITMPGRRDPPSTQAHSWRPASIFLRRRRQPLRLGRHRKLLRSFPRCARCLSHRRSKR